MYFIALATDFDGTIAEDGALSLRQCACRSVTSAVTMDDERDQL